MRTRICHRPGSDDRLRPRPGSAAGRRLRARVHLFRVPTVAFTTIVRSLAILVLVLGAWCESFAAWRIEGLRRTRAGTVEQVASASRLETCDSQCVAADLDALDRLGIFAEVSSRRVGDTLVYRVRELPWLLPVPNGRVSDEDGVSLGAGVKMPNLGGRAIAGEFLFLLGPSREFQVSMASDRVGAWPVAFDVFTARVDRDDEQRGFDEESHTGRIRLGWPSDRSVRVEGAAQALDLGIDRDASLSGDGRDLLLSGTFGILVETRDRRSLVREGGRHELSLERIGGDADGWMVLADLRHWVPVGERFTLHCSFLGETQWGRLGPWRTFVIGGGNSARGLGAGALAGRSERLLTGEVRWLAHRVRPVRLLGQDLYWGSELVAGVDGADVVDGPSRWGAFLSWDHSVPFVERVRLSAGADPQAGWKAAFALGLFEKSSAQRFRVR